ncbi:MAG: ATP-binding protein [Leptospiraceae bacterium]|nr:ATP-binding protein [Leptospiraceae bacterium]
MAEYFRSKHATRSKELIDQPSRIGLKSPRTGLIPSRLFSLLGKITESHGKDHEYVMNFPQFEDGIGMDKCHPRLIAFLLRLGDLLDIDNGRFCPVMLSSFGTLPKTSETHYEKHDSIEHLNISQSAIEITAKTDNYEVHGLLSKWFDWIKEEIVFINNNLSQIIPSVDFGGFPSANNLIVELLGYEIVENSHRLKVDIDPGKVIEMLRGTSLYSSSNVFIREILQNSVDATLLKYFCDNKSDLENLKSPNEFFEKLKKDDRYKISIHLSEVPKLDRNVTFRMEIEDSGIGISREEISYLLNMGTSYNNSRRKKIVKQMPEWMKPSGFFGIGFHSIFQVVDDVTISTKSIYDSCQYEIQFAEKGKQVKIRKVTNEDILTKSFTKITIDIESEKIPERFTYKYENEKALETISNFDALLDDEFPIKKANLIYDINDFVSDYQIPIYLNDYQLNKQAVDAKGIFCPESNSYIKINPVMSRLPGSNIFYRNQLVLKNTRDLYLKYLVYELDVMDGKADDYLTFSREKLSHEGIKRVDEILEKEVRQILELNYEQHPENKKLLSLAYHSNFDKSTEIIGDEWKDFEVNQSNDSSKFKTLREILLEESLTLKYQKKVSENEVLILKIVKDEYILDSRLDILDFFVEEIHKEFPHYKFLNFKNYSENTIIGNIPIQDRVLKKEFYFSKTEFTETEIILPGVLKSFFDNYKQHKGWGAVVKRTLLPLFSIKYTKISMEYISARSILPFIQSIYDSDFNIFKDFIINPFVFENNNWKVKGLEEAKQKTFKIKREKDNLIKLEEISKLFDELVAEIKGILKDESGE